MQNKYLSALRTTYASVGLSREALDRVALQRLKTINSEEEIASDVASLETSLLVMKEVQGSADVLRTRLSQTQKELDDLKKPQVAPVPEENPFATQMAEMKELLMGMQSRIAESEKKARTEAVIRDIHEKMKEMGCTNEYIRTSTLAGLQLSETDTAESVAERFKAAYDKNCRLAFGEGYIPPKGNNGGGNEEVNYGAMVAALKNSGAIPK